MNLLERFEAIIQKVIKAEKKDIYGESPNIYHCGDVSDEVPPVLIPNTEVKLISADNT